ncbi:MAG TPA: hypothetical protein VJZ25_06625, partial [Gemmatimonadaceae bacterium]|nr:hypothetical protein [Gemmatimonadaceae bacterium]
MPDPKSPLPATVPQKALLDRQALERVLARAAELQGAGAMPDPNELLSESQLREIGAEVGLTPATINQALAEERTRVVVPEESGFIAQLAGGRLASATRTVPGTQAPVMAALDTWMQREECLQVERRFADRITWEPQRSVFGKLKRAVNISGRGYHLVDAQHVSATVLPVDANRVVVRLDADLTASRSRRLGGGSAMAAAGTLGSAVLGFGLIVAHLPLILAAGIAVIPFVGGAMGGYSFARGQRK